MLQPEQKRSQGNTVRLASASADSRLDLAGVLSGIELLVPSLRISLWSLSDSQPVNVLEGHEDLEECAVVSECRHFRFRTESTESCWMLSGLAQCCVPGRSTDAVPLRFHPMGEHVISTSHVPRLSRLFSAVLACTRRSNHPDFRI